MIKRFTIVGNPVEHSISPELFRAGYPNRPEFIYDKCLAQSAEDCVELFKSGYSGGNVTSPFKEGVLRLADEVSAEAFAIGAVNAVIVSAEGKLSAFNTDYIGVSESLKEFGAYSSDKKYLLLGAGGAGKAAAFALSKLNVPFAIAGRRAETIEPQAAKTGAVPIILSDKKQFYDAVENADVIINTLYPQADVIPEELLDERKVVFDASYVGSALLNKAKRKTCLCIDGRYWVYRQALPAFVRFTGLEPDRQAVGKAAGIRLEKY